MCEQGRVRTAAIIDSLSEMKVKQLTTADMTDALRWASS